MKIRNAVLLATVVSSMLAITGCKSEYEKYADESCACKDADCIKKVSEAHKGMLGGEKTTLKELDAKLKELPEKDKKAFERGFECAMKIAFADVKGGDKKEDKKDDK